MTRIKVRNKCILLMAVIVSMAVPLGTANGSALPSPNSVNDCAASVLFLKNAKAKLTDEEQIPYLLRAVDLCSSEHGEDGITTTAARHNLTNAYYKAKKYDDALQVGEKNFTLRKKTLGKSHVDTLESMNRLAVIYEFLFKFDKSLALHEECLALRISAFGEENEATLQSMHSIGYVYRTTFQLDKALSFAIKCLALRTKVLGSDHVDTLYAMQSLGDTYNRLGDYQNAIGTYEKCFNLQKAKFGEDSPITLETMFLLGYNYKAIGQYEQCLEVQEKCYNFRRAKLGDSHADTLWSMQAVALAYYDLGQYQKSLDLNEKCLASWRANFGEGNPGTMHSMYRISDTYKALGQYGKALESAKKCLELRQAKLGVDHSETLWAMQALAGVYSVIGQHEKAIDLNKKCLEFRRSKLGEDHPDTLESMWSLASCYSRAMQIAAALALKEKCFGMTLTRFGAIHPVTLARAHGLAVVYSNIGRRTDSLKLLLNILPLVRSKLGEDHNLTLQVVNSLSGRYWQFGQFQKALELFERNLIILKAKFGENHQDTLMCMSNIALSFAQLGRIDKCLEMELHILQLRRKLLGTDHEETLWSLHNVSMAYRNLGRYDKAIELDEQCYALRRAKLGETHCDTMFSMEALAASYAGAGQKDKAFALRERVLQLRRKVLGQDHPNTINSMSELIDSLIDLDRLSQALVLIQQYVASAEKWRVMPGTGQDEKQSMFVEISNHYKRYSIQYAKANKLVEGFNLGDLAKARTLSESLRVQAAKRSLPAAEQAKLAQIETQSAFLATRLTALQKQTKPDPQALLTVQGEIEALHESFSTINGQLNKRYPKFSQLNVQKSATASDAKHLLADNEVFISYLITESGGVQIWIIDKHGEPKSFHQSSFYDFTNFAAAYRETISPSNATSAEGKLYLLGDNKGVKWVSKGETMPVGSKLVSGDPHALLNKAAFDFLIKPILPVVAKYPRWIISPDMELALLPFDIFPAGNGKMLGQEHNLTLVQSFSVYALLKQREVEYSNLKRSKDILAMGNAVYADGWAERRGINRNGAERGFKDKYRNVSLANMESSSAPQINQNAEQYALSQFELKNLPGTEREVRAVAEVFGGSANSKGVTTNKVDVFMGYDASEGNLQKLNTTGKLQDYRYLLFSAHGYLAQNPVNSSLVLSLKGNPKGVDGFVSASEWPQYDVKSDLTVLSACDTGVGVTQSGEGVMGLPYALFIAGNRNTMLTLWPVDDEATAEFMKIFFTKLKSGMSQPEALSKTKIEFLQHKSWSDPRYWAAFVLYGA